MACPRHNLRMVRLALAGRTSGPAHARLLLDVRRCRWCGGSPRLASGPRPPAPTVRVPEPRRERGHVASR
jgi:hypothetical protein